MQQMTTKVAQKPSFHISSGTLNGVRLTMDNNRIVLKKPYGRSLCLAVALKSPDPKSLTSIRNFTHRISIQKNIRT